MLKPFTGVGDTFLQRHAIVIVTAAATLLCLPYGFSYAVTTPWLLVPMVVPVVILMGLTVWALPDSNFLPETTIERLFFAYFVALMLWPNYVALDLPGLPWVTLARIVNTPLILIVLITLSTSAAFRTRIGAILSAAPTIWKALLACIVLQTMSLAFSAKPSASLAQWVIHQTNEAAIFFISAFIFCRRGRIEIWAVLLWASVIIVSAMATLEFRTQHPLWAGFVPSFLLVQDETVQRILGGFVRSTTGQYRATAVFTTPLDLSEFMALATPIILHFAVSTYYRPIVRIAAAATIPVVLMVILMTDSRLGLIGLFLSLMLYLFYWALQRYKQDRSALLATSVLMAYPAIAAVFVVASFTVGRLRARVWGTGQYDGSTQARYDQIEKGLPLILKRPFGHGLGTGAEALDFRNPEGTLTIDVYYLLLALDYGLLGLVSFVVMFAVSAYTAGKHVIASRPADREMAFLTPVAIAFVVFLVIKAVLAQGSNHPFMFMMMGMLVALVYRMQNASGPTTAAGRPK
jgi:hypothetical protein